MSEQQRSESSVAAVTRQFAEEAEDPIKGLDTTIKWQMIWLEAIALAWRDERFKAELLDNPRKAQRGYFNFDLGPYVKLTVREASPAPGRGNDERRADNTASEGAGHRTKLKHAFHGWNPAEDPLTSEMIMALPPAPPLEDQAVALSFYNTRGRAYPFTCC